MIPHDKDGPLAGWARLLDSQPSVCLRWGPLGAPDQCLLPKDHLGPCVTKQGQTLPLYHRMPGVTK